MRRRLLNFVMILFLLFGLSVCQLTTYWYSGYESVAQTAAKTSNPRWTDFKEWMKDSWYVVKDTRICDVVIPGAHDAGTYNLYVFNETQIDPRFPDLSAFMWVPGLRGALENFVRGSSVTQEVNVYAQLVEGNRFLDIRFKKCKNDGKLRTFHGMFGEEMRPVLSQIRMYMQQTEKEVVLMRLNCCGAMWDLDDNSRIEIAKATEEILGDYMVDPKEIKYTNTIEDVVKTKKRLIVTCTDELIHKNLPKSFFEKGDEFKEGFKGNTTVEDSLNSVYNSYNEYRNNPKYKDTIFKVKIFRQFDPNILGNEVSAKLKKADLKGAVDALNNFTSLYELNKKYLDTIIANMINIGNVPTGYRPNVFVRDFYSKDEIMIVLLKNFGKAPGEVVKTRAKLEELYNKNKENSVLGTITLIDKLRKDISDKWMYSAYDFAVPFNEQSSSSNGNNKALLAFDNNNQTKWEASNTSWNQWVSAQIATDNDNLFNVENIFIDWADKENYKFSIDISNDNKNWTPIVDKTKSDLKVQSFTFKNIDKKAKFVRVFIKAIGGNNKAGIKTVKFYGHYDKPQIKLPIISSWATNAEKNNPVSHGVDENPFSRWCAIDSNIGYEYGVELKEPSYVYSIGTDFEFADKYIFSLSGSNDKKTWEHVNVSKQKDNVNKGRYQINSVGKTYKYYKIHFNGADKGHFASLREFYVFGY